MKKTGVVIACLLSMAAWGQRTERNVLRFPKSARLSGADSSYRPASRNKKATPAASTNDAPAPGQAPGVVQLVLVEGELSAWFVATDTIPANTPLTAYINVQNNDANGNGEYLKTDTISYSTDITPGTSLILPKIAKFGDFWPAGVTTYDVVVNLNGTNTHSAADFTIGAARNYSDLVGSSTSVAITPLIYSWSESVSNQQVYLTVTGNFTSDPVTAVLEDLVVPPSAISRSADGTTITVNLSQVPGSRLDIYQDFLLTIGQAGYSDTRVFTHVPFNPSSYTPSLNLQ